MVYPISNSDTKAESLKSQLVYFLLQVNSSDQHNSVLKRASTQPTYGGIRDVFRGVYAEGGVRALYRGVGMVPVLYYQYFLFKHPINPCSDH
jgi:hypothetical protein